VIDTELFTAAGQRRADLPVAAEPSRWPSTPSCRAGGRAAQIYVPEWFHGVTANKEKDVGAFLEGTAAYLRDQKQKKEAGASGLRRWT